jgi:ADP-heptose:LPS heptosyltransferase
MQSLSHAPDVAIRSGTLSELAGAVGAATLVLAVDTFATHLAVASDVPTVCLIGGGQFGDFGPWQRSPRQRWISNPLPCFGCNWQCTRTRVECLQDIAPSMIVSAIEAVWQAKSAGQPAPVQNQPKEAR